MLPYVAVSWLTARLADALRRVPIVRTTLMARGVLLAATAAAAVTHHPWLAVGLCTLAVTVSTPAYPALVAAMPGVAGALRGHHAGDAASRHRATVWGQQAGGP